MQATSDVDVSLEFITTIYMRGNPTLIHWKAEVYWFTVHASVYRQRQRSGFSSFATCMFTLGNVVTARIHLMFTYVNLDLLKVNLYEFCI